jgi:hypothetical protein
MRTALAKLTDANEILPLYFKPSIRNRLKNAKQNSHLGETDSMLNGCPMPAVKQVHQPFVFIQTLVIVNGK